MSQWGVWVLPSACIAKPPVASIRRPLRASTSTRRRSSSAWMRTASTIPCVSRSTGESGRRACTASGPSPRSRSSSDSTSAIATERGLASRMPGDPTLRLAGSAATADEEGPGLTTEAQALPDPELIGRSRGTDFYGVDDLIPAEERELRDRVRAFCDDVVVPVAAQAWEDAVLPASIRDGLRDLGIAGGSIQGYECPGMSVLGSHLVLSELARGDGSVATYHGVHTGLAMLSIGMLGSEEQKERWLPSMAR